MPGFQKARYTPKDLVILNNCQMFLQVMTISEISNHTGTHLLPEAIQNGKTSPTLVGISTSKYKWPHQSNPGPSAWKLWTHTLQAVYTKPGLPTMLIQHLGDWYPTASIARTWHATYHPDTQTVTIVIPNQDTVSYLLKSHTQSHMYYDQPTWEMPSPLILYPVTISKQCKGFNKDIPIIPIPTEEQPDIPPPLRLLSENKTNPTTVCTQIVEYSQTNPSTTINKPSQPSIAESQPHIFG